MGTLTLLPTFRRPGLPSEQAGDPRAPSQLHRARTRPRGLPPPAPRGGQCQCRRRRRRHVPRVDAGDEVDVGGREDVVGADVVAVAGELLGEVVEHDGVGVEAGELGRVARVLGQDVAVDHVLVPAHVAGVVVVDAPLVPQDALDRVLVLVHAAEGVAELVVHGARELVLGRRVVEPAEVHGRARGGEGEAVLADGGPGPALPAEGHADLGARHVVDEGHLDVGVPRPLARVELDLLPHTPAAPYQLDLQRVPDRPRLGLDHAQVQDLLGPVLRRRTEGATRL